MFNLLIFHRYIQLHAAHSYSKLFFTVLTDVWQENEAWEEQKEGENQDIAKEASGRDGRMPSAWRTHPYKHDDPSLIPDAHLTSWVQASNLNTGEVETGGFLGLARQLVLPNQQAPGSMRLCLKK